MRSNQRGPRSQHDQRDRGSSTLELAILFPVVMLLVFGVVQGALWYHARNVALAAATEGLEVARVETGTGGAGRDAAASFVSRAGGSDVLLGVGVAASRTATRASITVTGRSISVLPGLPGPPVSQSAAGAVERFTSEANP